MNSPTEFDFYEDLIESVVDCACNNGTAAIVAKSEIIGKLIPHATQCCSPVYLDFEIADEYDTETYDYFIEIVYDEKKDNFEFSVECATNDMGTYLVPEGRTIYKHKDVPNRCISDIFNNELTEKDTVFIEFAFADEENCEECPERFDCPDYVSDNMKTETNGTSTTVVRNSDGGIRGFSYNKTYTDESDKTSSFSWNFFSDDLNAIKTIAAELGIKL